MVKPYHRRNNLEENNKYLWDYRSRELSQMTNIPKAMYRSQNRMRMKVKDKTKPTLIYTCHFCQNKYWTRRKNQFLKDNSVKKNNQKFLLIILYTTQMNRYRELSNNKRLSGNQINTRLTWTARNRELELKL